MGEDVYDETEEDDDFDNGDENFFLSIIQEHTVIFTNVCGEEDQTNEHVLQICNRHQPERIAQWPSATPLHQKKGGLGGPEEDHQLHHCCWTGRVSEREEEEEVSK